VDFTVFVATYSTRSSTSPDAPGMVADVQPAVKPDFSDGAGGRRPKATFAR